MKAKCISNLITAGWKLFVPLHDAPHILGTSLEWSKESPAKILITGISHDKERAPILKTDPTFFIYDFICCGDDETQTVWLFPTDIFTELTSIRLGKKYEEYVIPEPTSLDYKAQKDRRLSMRADLQTTAESAVRKLVEGSTTLGPDDSFPDS